MTYSRATLLGSACVLLGFGVYGLLAPDKMLRPVNVRASSRGAKTELRAMYGGFELGLGAFFAAAAFMPELERAALWAQLLSTAGLASVRLGSLIYDRPGGALLKGVFAFEAAAAVAQGFALRSRAA